MQVPSYEGPKCRWFLASQAGSLRPRDAVIQGPRQKSSPSGSCSS